MPEKSLKKGFTTGAAAAAATKAALHFLLSGEKKSKVKIRFLNGETTLIAILSITKISKNAAKAIIIKDAGDDPDITHKAQIGVCVSISKNSSNGLEIIGGKGVGIVTKPGLELNVGEYAINPGPKKMIKESVNDVFSELGITVPKDLTVEVFVPKGEELAKKTLNSRLGIKGGISILGTTGIVTPMSHAAYIATIKAGAKIAAAGGAKTLVFTTGRRSERFAMDLFYDFKEECFIQTGDFFKASINEAKNIDQIESLVFAVFFGKAVKMAMGFEHTHAAKSELTMQGLVEWSEKIYHDKTLTNNIQNSNTARHAFSYIYPEFPDLLSYVGNKIVENAGNFASGKLNIRSLIFDFDGNPVFDSHHLFVS